MTSTDDRPAEDSIHGDLTRGELAQHGDSLRRLARGLLADLALAEDVVQDAFVSALERPPASRFVLSTWLRRVVRNRANDQRKADRRRRDREQVVAGTPSPEQETAERLEVEAKVFDAVRALHEPYRTTVV